MAESKLVSGY